MHRNKYNLKWRVAEINSSIIEEQTRKSNLGMAAGGTSAETSTTEEVKSELNLKD